MASQSKHAIITNIPNFETVIKLVLYTKIITITIAIKLNKYKNYNNLPSHYLEFSNNINTKKNT